jgi:hypothetical protein
MWLQHTATHFLRCACDTLQHIIQNLESMCPRFYKPSAPAPNLCSPCVCERVYPCCRHVLQSYLCCRHVLQSLSPLCYAESLSLAQKEFLPPGISFQIPCRISLTFVMQSLSHMQSFSLAVRESVTVADTCCGVSLTFVVQSLSHLQSFSLAVRESVTVADTCCGVSFTFVMQSPVAVSLTCSQRVCHCCRHLLRSLSHFCYAESL